MNHTRKLSHLYHTIGYINVQAFLFNFCGFITQKKKKQNQNRHKWAFRSQISDVVK